jgi:hypothetical protein
MMIYYVVLINDRFFVLKLEILWLTEISATKIGFSQVQTGLSHDTKIKGGKQLSGGMFYHNWNVNTQCRIGDYLMFFVLEGDVHDEFTFIGFYLLILM